MTLRRRDAEKISVDFPPRLCVGVYPSRRPIPPNVADLPLSRIGETPAGFSSASQRLSVKIARP
jgi:hypothetical protein